MTWLQVKKHLQNFGQAALLDLVHHMYNVSDINKAFLTARFQPGSTLDSKELADFRFQPGSTLDSKELADFKKRIHRLGRVTN